MWRPAPLAALLAALALAACSNSTSTSTSRPSATSMATATATTTASHSTPASAHCFDLRPSYVGTQGATGHLEVTLALRNVSTATCRVSGYPWAQLLDRTGQRLPMRLKFGNGFFPDTTRAPRSVVLKPGAQARFGLSFVTNNEFAGAHTCRTAASFMAGVAGWAGRRRVQVSLRAAPRISPCGRELVVSPVYG